MNTTAPRTDPHGTESVALRESGLKVTVPRLHVLSALTARPHATADDVFQSVITGLPDTSVQTVYGVLSALTDAGLVRRIEPAGSPARYERRIGDNHHHIVCTRCGNVADVDCSVGHAPCLTPSSTNGFTVVTAEVTYWGLCAECSTAGESPAA